MGLDVRMNTVEELRESEMEIEKNREEVLAYIRNWVEEIREAVFSWISKGESRSKSAGNGIEIQLGVLGSCLEGVMEEIQEEGTDKYEQKTSEIASHMSNVERWTSFVRAYLKKVQEDAMESKFKEELLDLPERTVSKGGGYDVDSDKAESIDGCTGEEMDEKIDSNGGLTREGPASKGENALQSTIGAEPAVSIVVEPETKEEDELDGDEALQIGIEKEATIDQRWRGEDLAGEFEKIMTIAARERQSTDAVWILGWKEHQRFEPIYFLVKGTSELGFEPEMEHLGPPPWARQSKDEIDAKQWNRASQMSAMEDEKVSWNNLKSRQEVDERRLRVVRVSSRKTGLGLENQTGSFQFGEERDSAYSFGPDIKMLGPPPWPNTSIKKIGPNSLPITHGSRERYEGQDIGHLLRPESIASQIPRQIFEPPPPPPAKPPLQPPDFPSDFSRLEFSPTVSDSLPIPYPISVHICGKEDAAGDDPGDGRFHQFPTSSASNLNFTSSLEGKADLKGAARALITTRDCSFVLPIPPEPPPIPPCDLELIMKRHMQHKLWIMTWYGDSKIGDYTSQGDKLLAEENHEDDRMLLLFNHSPRLPEFAYNEEVPLNDRKGDDWLIKDISLQVQVEIEFRMSTELLHLTSSWEVCISRGKWELKLNLVNASADFRILVVIAQKVEIGLWASNHNIHVLADAKGVLRWNLSMQGLCAKDHDETCRDTNINLFFKNDQLTHQEDCTHKNLTKQHPKVEGFQEAFVKIGQSQHPLDRCTDMDMQSPFSYYNLEDKVVLKEGGIVRTQNSLFEKQHISGDIPE